MNPELQNLKDIHLPQAIHGGLIAPGWIILLIVLPILAAGLIYLMVQHRKKKTTVRYAMAKLSSLRNLLVENPDNINIAAEISILIRRTALHYFRREEIAGLSGKDWVEFLNRSGTHFNEETGRVLINAPYRKNIQSDLLPLFDVTQAWLAAISKKTAEKRHV